MKKTIKYLSIIILILLFLVETYEADAQRRRRTTDEPATSFSDQLWYGIHLGNLNFFSGNFSISGKFSTAYKMNDRFSAGLAGKTFFDILEVFNGPDLNLFSYGFGPFVRVKVAGGVFLHGEYDLTSYEDYDPFDLTTSRETYNYPLIGGGYESGQGKWTYGIKVLFVMDEEVRELTVKDVVEWWITFSYNF